jgi:glycosyltransferase involved in cell wall biosynthesis
MTQTRISVVGALPPYRGGISHCGAESVRGLRARGYEVQALSFSRQYPGFLFPGTSQTSPDASADDIGAKRCIDTLNPLTWWDCARRLREFDPAAVLFHHWMPFFAPAYGTILRRLDPSRTRRLCLTHNAIPHERRPGDLALSRYLFRACDGFIAWSRSVEQDLRKLGVRAPIRQVDHPTHDIFGTPMDRPEARAQLGLDPHRPTLLFFGYIRPYKGLDDLVEAFARARDRRPDLQLLVVGEFYEGEERIRARIAELGLGDDLKLVSRYVADHEVAAWFSACDVVVQPYRSATQSGVVPIAFRFERPVILTDVGGLAEVVPHEVAGLVVPPDDTEALASALVRFFEEDWSTRLEQGVRAGRHRFSWDRVLDAFEELAGLTGAG